METRELNKRANGGECFELELEKRHRGTVSDSIGFGVAVLTDWNCTEPEAAAQPSASSAANSTSRARMRRIPPLRSPIHGRGTAVEDVQAQEIMETTSPLRPRPPPALSASKEDRLLVLSACSVRACGGGEKIRRKTTDSTALLSSSPPRRFGWSVSMEEEEGFDRMEEGGFLELLGSGAEQGGYLFAAPSSLSSPSSSCYSSLTAAQMLCFGGKEEAALAPHAALAQRSADSSSISSLSSSPNSTAATTTININSGSSKTSKKKAGSGGGGGGRRTASATTTSTTLTANKKPKTEACASAGHGAIKVRKEKLGDRIMALQQLVSPFGKSDTASVLHEAMGYIRFLHDQVQVLSSPYLQGTSSADHIQDGRGNDLRSRGLCLVPISCTEHVTSSNGADLWSPAMGGGEPSPSSKH